MTLFRRVADGLVDSESFRSDGFIRVQADSNGVELSQIVEGFLGKHSECGCVHVTIYVLEDVSNG